jgi:uncharacterized membrane protein YphA (DoxX/SURF4 family)
MTMTDHLRRAPTRLATGAFILNSGINKLRADADTAKQVHGMAAGAYPALGKLDPPVFTKGLAVGETALGAALLLPVVPTGLAAAGLLAFSGGLLGMYWRTPGLHKQGSPLPTEHGVPIAKDIWMAGIAGGLLIDAATAKIRDGAKRLRRS